MEENVPEKQPGVVEHMGIHKKDMVEGLGNGSPVINMIPDGARGYDNNGLGALAGILPLALLAPLFGLNRRDGEGREGRNLEAVIAEQVADLRHDIGESTVEDIKQSFRSEIEGVKAGFRAELEAKETKFDLSEKIDEEGEEIENKVECLKADVDNKFCELSRQMERGFARIAESEKDREIHILRERLESSDRANQTTQIITSILSAVGVPTPVALAKKSE